MGLLNLGSIYKKKKKSASDDSMSPAPKLTLPPKIELLPLDLNLDTDGMGSGTLSIGLPKSTTAPAGISRSLMDDIVTELNVKSPTATAAQRETEGDLLRDLTWTKALSEQLERINLNEVKPTPRAQSLEASAEEIRNVAPSLFATPDNTHCRTTPVDQPQRQEVLPLISTHEQKTTEIPVQAVHRRATPNILVLDSDFSDSEEQDNAKANKLTQKPSKRHFQVHPGSPKSKKSSWSNHAVPSVLPSESGEAAIERMKDRHRQQFKMAALRQQQYQQQMLLAADIRQGRGLDHSYRMPSTPSFSSAPLLPSMPSVSSMPSLYSPYIPTAVPRVHMNPPSVPTQPKSVEALTPQIRRSAQTSSTLSEQSDSTVSSNNTRRCTLSRRASTDTSFDGDADDECDSDSDLEIKSKHANNHLYHPPRNSTSYTSVLSSKGGDTSDDNNDVYVSKKKKRQSLTVPRQRNRNTPKEIQPGKIRHTSSSPNLKKRKQKDKQKQSCCHNCHSCHETGNQSAPASPSRSFAVLPPHFNHCQNEADFQTQVPYFLSQAYKKRLQMEWDHMQSHHRELHQKRQPAQQFFQRQLQADPQASFLQGPSRITAMPLTHQTHMSYYQQNYPNLRH